MIIQLVITMAKHRRSIPVRADSPASGPSLHPSEVILIPDR